MSSMCYNSVVEKPDYFLSKHAKERAEERLIRISDIELTLLKPDKLLYNEDNKLLFKRVYGKKRNRLLIIVAERSNNKLKVITIIDTTNIKKYL